MGKHRDWTDIANDYRENGLSFSQLAAKYDVPIDTLKKASARQGWSAGTDKRKRSRIRNAQKAIAKAESKMAPPQMAPTSEMAPRTKMAPRNCSAPKASSVILVEPVVVEDARERFRRLIDGMMDRVEQAIEIVPPEQVQALKLLTGALKDLSVLQRLDKDELDIEEQRARIAKLKSETRISESDGAGGVLILPTIEDRLLPPDTSSGLRTPSPPGEGMGGDGDE